MNKVVQMQQAGLPDSSALPLFITQCLDRVETRCLAGRIDPKEQPDSHGKEEGDKNRCCRDDCLKARRLGNGHCGDIWQRVRIEQSACGGHQPLPGFQAFASERLALLVHRDVVCHGLSLAPSNQKNARITSPKTKKLHQSVLGSNRLQKTTIVQLLVEPIQTGVRTQLLFPYRLST